MTCDCHDKGTCKCREISKQDGRALYCACCGETEPHCPCGCTCYDAHKEKMSKAAPDLLSACRLALQDHEDERHVQSTENALRAAIARAEA